jgi:hypothetical protein
VNKTGWASVNESVGGKKTCFDGASKGLMLMGYLGECTEEVLPGDTRLGHVRTGSW